jgi:hypothetical protein
MGLWGIKKEGISGTIKGIEKNNGVKLKICHVAA